MSIRLGLRRGAGLIAAAGLLAGLGVAAPDAQAATQTHTVAATPRPAGNLYQGLGYVPKSVKRGHSIVVSIWFMQRSPDNMQLMAAGLRVDGPSAGVRVDWLDPVTKRWEPTTGDWGTGDSYYRQLPDSPRLVYRSGVWGHVYVRITFTSRAHLGDWYVMPNTPYEYQLWTKSGKPVQDGFLSQPTGTVGAPVRLHA